MSSTTDRVRAGDSTTVDVPLEDRRFGAGVPARKVREADDFDRMLGVNLGKVRLSERRAG